MEWPLRPSAPAAEIVPTRASAARAGVRIAVGAILGAVAYRDLLWSIPERSLSEELEQFFFVPSQSVAPLVVVLAAWLAFRRADRLRACGADVARGLAAVLLACGAALHLWASATGAPDLLAPSLACVVLGIGAAWGGREAVRVLALPAAFLLFAMPLPAPLLNEVVFRLQVATADLTGVLLALLRVPHTVAGDQILRTHQTFSVIEACSGLRSIETLTMVAVLMADLFRRRGLHAVLLVAAAPPVALFFNGWRAVTLILNPHSEIVAVHNLQGIAILLAGLLLLFVYDGLLARLLRGRDRSAGGAEPPRPLPPTAPRRLPAWPLGVLGALAVAALWLPRFPLSPPEPMLISARLGSGIGDLFSRELETDRLFLGSAGFRDSATRRFTREGHAVDAFVGVGWRAGRARSALSPKTAIPGSGWILERSEPRRLEPGGVIAWTGIYRSATQRLLVYHWYEGSQGVVREALRSLSAIDSTPWGGSLEGEMLVVRLSTDLEAPVASGLGPAQQRLDAFYRELRPVLDRIRSRESPQARASAPARRKALPDFHGWEKHFLSGWIPDSDEIVENQVVEIEFELGMPIAKSAGEAGAVPALRGQGAVARRVEG